MIAVLKQSASDDAVSHIVSWIEKKGLKTDVSRGENETIIGLVGDTTKIDPFLLESMDVVERVQRVSEPFKRANRKFHPEDSVIDCGHGVKIGGDQFQVIAGPCSVEGENLIRIARRVKAAGATMLRGGAYKPRTSPYAYQGMGPAGLDLLCEASAELDMPIVTEIMDPRDVQVFLDKKIDVMQIGARNAQNFPLLKEVGKTQTPILLKRGMSGTIDELLMAAEYIMSEGNDNVILCERGIRTFETSMRNTLDLAGVVMLHKMTHLPVVVDPSHACGHAWMVPELAKADAHLRDRLLGGGKQLPPDERERRQQRVINAARRFTEDPHSLHPLNPVWDNRFMSLLEQGRLSELDAIGNDELSAMAGKSTHEIKTWVAAFAALSAFGRWRSEGRYYRPIPEWIAGFGSLSATTEI